MPRLKNRLPSYRHHKPSGQALACLAGRRVYLGKYDSPESREAYDRVIAEWVANGRRARPGPANGDKAKAGTTPGAALTVAEVIAAYWVHVEAYYRLPDGTPTKERETIRQALRPLRKLYGRAAAAAFDAPALKAVRGAMVELGWARTHVNKQVSRVRQAFKWAVAEGLVPAAVHHGLVTVGGLKRGRGDARESDPVRPAPEAFVSAALPFLSRPLRAVVALQLVTGMRPGEACAMRGADVDTAGRLWAYRPGRHKTQHHGHERAVYLGPKAQAIIRPFLKPDLSAHLFSPAEAEAERRERMHAATKTPAGRGNGPGTHVAKAPRRKPGGRYSVASYARAVRRACDKADQWAKAGKVIDEKERLVPRWHPHQLRHNAATRLRKEFGLEAAQVILGHKTLTVTQVYAEKNVEAARKIMGEVG